MSAGGPSQLRGLLARGGIVAAPGAYDPLTARIIERSGASAIYLGGNGMALGLGKGQPFITSTETAEIVARVARAVDTPLIVDAGAGFGEAAHVHVAVREIEAAGAAALHIDDQPYPKRAAYHRGEATLADAETVVAKLKVAVAARRNPDLMIIARTDALRATKSITETVDRARAYAGAGIDALMILDLDPARAAAIGEALPHVPLMWIGGVAPPIPTLAELEASGFRVALYPFNTVGAVSLAVADLWADLAGSGRVNQSDEALARARRETLALADMELFWDIEANTAG